MAKQQQHADYSQMSFEILIKEIELPKFQRGLVWSAKKKRDLINTLNEGFPFGAILIYEQDGKNVLLDGQQRLSTIKEYRENPLAYWKPLNKDKYDSELLKLNEIVKENITEKNFDSMILNRNDEFDDWIDDLDNKEIKKPIRQIFNDIKKELSEFIDLSNLQIPYLKYTGDASRIADVFANLNKGGTPLNKYEIFNAAWSREQLKLGNSEYENEIIKYVERYYDDLAEDAQFELSDYSSDDLKSSRKVSVAEFGTALGKMIVDKMPALISNDASNEFGFGILGIAMNLENKKISELIAKKSQIQSNIVEILETANRLASVLNAAFSKILQRNHNSKTTKYETGLSTTFKILSYFAALWDLVEDSEDYIQSLKNMPAYYVMDSISNRWGSHGDQTLQDYYASSLTKKNYISAVEIDRFKSIFNNWLDEQTAGILFNAQIRAITTIHANLTYLSDELSTGETYEFEHVIPKSILAKYDTQPLKVLGGSLGNAMFLPKKLNNAKKANTLYDISGSFDDLIKQSHYFSESEFGEIFKNLEISNFGIVNNIIIERAHKVIDDVTRKLTETKF
ncbi:DUF262 domain-containing protein [Leuconostoc falkenbergense]|uniref:DUF262 domain-containing protein n=1 Tax=Leuconostoc falkenbergense TaxID=2766470 RepID=UPI0028AAE59F|nr:DUF262 domain-containing protein [Leuconostoc falkenbergense]